MEVRNGVREFGSWSEQKSSSGKRYYYNKDTEVSQWDKPDEWKEWERVQEAAANTRVPPPPLPPMPPPPPHHNTSVPPPPITMPSMHFMQQPPPNYAHSAHQAAAFVPSQQTQSFNAAQVAAAAAAFHNAMPIGFHHHQPPPNITQPPPTQHTQHTPVQQHPFVQMSTSVPPPPSPMFAGKPTTTTMSATFSHHNTPTRSSSQTTPRHMYGQHGGNSAHHTPSSHYDRTAAATRQDSSEVKMDIDNDSNSDRATPKAAPVRVAKRDSQNEERERPAKMARTAEPSPPVHRRSSVSPALSNGPPAPAKTDSPVQPQQPQQHDWMRFYSKELAEKAKPPGDDIQQKLVDYGLNDVKLHLELGKQLVDLKGIRALVQTAQMRVILNDRKLVHLAEAQRTLETKMREHSAGALNIPFSTSNTA